MQGHVYWWGRFSGEFAPLIDILCVDGAVMDAEGGLLRAATFEAVDDPMDRPVRRSAWRTISFAEAARIAYLENAMVIRIARRRQV